MKHARKNRINVLNKILTESTTNNDKRLLDDARRALAQTDRRSTLWSAGCVRGFLEGTSLHGFKYIVKGVTPLERFLWSLLMLWCLVMTSWYLWEAIRDTSKEPVILSLKSTHEHIGEYDFPAVTICPTNKINKSMAEKWLQSCQLPPLLSSAEALQLLHTLFFFIEPHNVSSAQITVLQHLLALNNQTIDSLYSLLAPSCESVLDTCRWHRRVASCSSLFQKVKTMSGYCCSFNYFAEYDEEHEDDPSSSYEEPAHLTSTGIASGLTVLVRESFDEYLTTSVASRGVQVLVHESFDHPSESSTLTLVPPDHLMYISVVADTTHAPTPLLSVPVPQRDCYFKHEKQLHLPLRYSFINCMVDCSRDTFIELCGCVPMMMPNSGTDKLCAELDLQCWVENEGELSTLYNESLGTSQEFGCDCRPRCDSVDYSIFRAGGPLVLHSSTSEDLLYQNVDDRFHYTQLHVYYSHMFAIKRQRVVRVSWYSLLATLGGILGMFLGFSFISAFEITFLFFIKPIMNGIRSIKQ